jgi:N-acetyl-anhydromuramyl-L-alanine amidase AmpD
VSGFYPKAIRKNIKPGSNDPEIVPALAILHVAVSITLSLFGFFRFRSGGIESHFYVRKDGTVEQYRNVLREADANLGANSYLSGGRRLGAVSIETAGFALGWWNKAQKAAILELLLWLHEEHDIPLKPVFVPHPSLAQGGVSWHSKFREWSPVAKSCPGPNRIIQFKRWLKPWMAEQSAPCLHCPKHCPSSEGDA